MKIAERASIVGAFGLMLWLLWSMVTASAEWYGVHHGTGSRGGDPPDAPLKQVEVRLRPIAVPKRPPEANDWLATHTEFGQTFAQYRADVPRGRDPQHRFIDLALIGDFSESQQRILDLTRDYMGRFFGAPVRIRKRMTLAELPAEATRVHPEWGTRQILTGFVLDKMLAPDRPADAPAYLAFTATDLTPGEGWNFVFGQASLRDRIGVWSMHRFGDPSTDPTAFRLCLRRTMNVASHETGHILSIRHCVAYECNMNGSNHLEESDRSPLHYCPVCTRKLCWFLGLDPADRERAMLPFFEQNGIDDERLYSGRALERLR